MQPTSSYAGDLKRARTEPTTCVADGQEDNRAWASLLVGVPFGVYGAKKCTRGGFHAVFYDLQPARFALTRKQGRLLGCFRDAASAGARWDAEERLVHGERALVNNPRPGERAIAAYFAELIAMSSIPWPPVPATLQQAELAALYQALAQDAYAAAAPAGSVRRSDAETGPGMQLLHCWFAPTMAATHRCDLSSKGAEWQYMPSAQDVYAVHEKRFKVTRILLEKNGARPHTDTLLLRWHRALAQEAGLLVAWDPLVAARLIRRYAGATAHPVVYDPHGRLGSTMLGAFVAGAATFICAEDEDDANRELLLGFGRMLQSHTRPGAVPFEFDVHFVSPLTFVDPFLLADVAICAPSHFVDVAQQQRFAGNMAGWRADYLETLLRNCMACVRPGGHLLVVFDSYVDKLRERTKCELDAWSLRACEELGTFVETVSVASAAGHMALDSVAVFRKGSPP